MSEPATYQPWNHGSHYGGHLPELQPRFLPFNRCARLLSAASDHAHVAVDVDRATRRVQQLLDEGRADAV